MPGKDSFKNQLYQTILEKNFNFVDRIPHHKEKNASKLFYRPLILQFI